MTVIRRLIINADDFGLSPGVNAGIIAGHTDGLLTSTTLMANGDAFDDAVALAHAHPTLSVGCHLVLLGGKPVAPAPLVASLVGPDGAFSDDFGMFLRNLIGGRLKREEIVTEFSAQVEKILSAGIAPTHLDSHKHSHAHPTVLGALLDVADRYRIPAIRRPFERTWHAPLETLGSGGVKTYAKQQLTRLILARYARDFDRCVRGRAVRVPDHFFGFAHTGLLTPKLLVYLLHRLPPGVSEVMCHPGRLDAGLDQSRTRLKASRVRELDALTAPEVRAAAAAAGVEPIGFRALA